MEVLSSLGILEYCAEIMRLLQSWQQELKINNDVKISSLFLIILLINTMPQTTIYNDNHKQHYFTK